MCSTGVTWSQYGHFDTPRENRTHKREQAREQIRKNLTNICREYIYGLAQQHIMVDFFLLELDRLGYKVFCGIYGIHLDSWFNFRRSM